MPGGWPYAESWYIEQQQEDVMNPIISATLADDRQHTLRAQAAQARRAAVADTGHLDAGHTAHARRAVTHPFAAFQGWLARGYL
jgi:hypothetical protein